MNRIYCLWKDAPAILCQQDHPRHLTYNLYLLKNEGMLANGWMLAEDLNGHIEDKTCIISEFVEILWG